MIEEVREQLFQLQDLDYQKFQRNLCPGVSHMIGVRIPDLRKIVKKILKQDFRIYLAPHENRFYEEMMIEGLLIATSKIALEEKLNYLKKFVPKIDNWAICDTVCASFHFSKAELPIVWNFCKQYQKSKKEFELRFLVVMMMDYFLIEEYQEQVLQIIDSLDCDYYYTNMAVAWLLSVFYTKNRKRVILYLRENHLSPFAYQKTIQKILESNRVSIEDKKIIRNVGIKGLEF